ncbi:MAG: AmmeMemoRadiSam system radical SAM enzyme [Clostridia bacterium]|nr:AmmeMemoRadiSam system radical SAM enzyme [Clostridia bacterium]
MENLKEALWYEKLEGNNVICRLCPHNCRISPGKRGICGVRKNQDGTLVAENYGRAGAVMVDPIEKKPLYHFYPGSYVLSAGARGCNFKCRFCQNWNLAHGEHQEMDVSPLGLINAVQKYSGYYDVIGIAYTYSEPLMWYEFVLDASKFARKSGLKNVLVTNGFIEEEPLKELLPYIDAMNIDVKGFNKEFYRKIVGGDYGPVLRTAVIAKDKGCHVEITNLIIPGLNDSVHEIRMLVDWVADNLGRETPLHFSRYFPHHELRLEPTPIATLNRARDIAREKLHHVYIGNVADWEISGTYCPHCGNMVIQRTGYSVHLSRLAGDRCAECGEHLNIVV